MKAKHLALLSIVFFTIKSTTSASCNYKEDQSSIFSFPINGYVCELSLESIDELESIVKLTGIHNTNKTDNDVKILKKSTSIELTIFAYNFCKLFNNLECIDMSGVEIESIDANSLLSCSKLRQLSFEKNSIREIPENLLKESLKLTHLTLSGNQLVSLSESVFSNQLKLEYLDLSYNKINLLPATIFKTLTRLKILLLNKNKVATLDPALFLNLRDLQRLNLNNNRLAELPVGIFKNLDFLENLKLKANYLTIVHSDSFGSEHDELTTLDISQNKINAIDEDFIQNSPISSLDVQGNVCSKEFLQHRTEIREKLKQCFSNYQKRTSGRKSQDCGKVKVGRQNVVGGTKLSKPGLVPWVALLTYKRNGDFFCGGTVITNTKVISTAHCIQNKHSETKLQSSEVTILLGVYDFDDKLDINRVATNVTEIEIHPDWDIKNSSFDADISILTLAQQIQYTAFIQPICLVEPDSTIAKVTSGTIVGYGKSEDESKLHENIPKVITTPIHSNYKCFLKGYDLIKLSSERTFCGGYGNGTGVCNGDAGFGLYVVEKNIFYLRGVLSSSLLGGLYICDVDSYAIYTDTPKYYDWIRQNSL